MKFTHNLQLNNNRNDITLIGEILVDKIRSSITHKSMGGSTLNITRNLKNMGISTNFFGAVGNDFNGEFLKKELSEINLDKTNIRTFKTHTTTVEVIDNFESPIPTFNRSSDYHIYFDESLINAIKNSKILHFSYWPLSKEPSKSTVLDSVKLAKENGLLIGFDPNYHKDLVNQESITNEELLELMKMVDIIKPSLDDTIRLFGERSSLDEYVKIYEDLGCQLVILTLGSKGIIAAYKGERIMLPSLAKNVVEVTGAGDAFWSGLYTGLLRKDNIYDSINLGLACSAYVLRVIGGQVDFPSVKEIKSEFNI